MENERLARVEESMKIMSPRVERIENKLDHLIEKSESRWGKVIGGMIVISFVMELIFEFGKHAF